MINQTLVFQIKFCGESPALRVAANRYIDSGEEVFVIDYCEETFSVTGKYMKSDFAFEYRVKDGEITEFNPYTDTFLIGQLMGLTRKSRTTNH